MKYIRYSDGLEIEVPKEMQHLSDDMIKTFAELRDDAEIYEK